MQTLCIVLATAYILLAFGAGIYCGRIVHNQVIGLVLGAISLLFVATLCGLHQEEVAIFWQVLVGGFAFFFLSSGTLTYIG